MRKNPCFVFVFAALVSTLASPAEADEWPTYAGDTARTGHAVRAARDLNSLRWIAPPGQNEEFVWHSSPVVYGGRVFVRGRLFAGEAQADSRVIALAVEDGHRLWAAPIAADAYGNWSSPAVDVRNGTVIAAAGDRVCALAVADGTRLWETTLDRVVVNASPVVTSDLTSGGVPANRVFITDYTGFDVGASLYAINVDPFDARGNPYLPGEIVWTHALSGASGNTPAYADGVVYVTSTGGEVKALNAADGTLVWETDVDLAGYPELSGFYGGIALRDGYAYAATYVFYGSGDNSGMFKFDLDDGAIVWVVSCERTAAMPVVTDDGRIYLAAGLDDYGSTVKVQAFADHGDWAEKVWETHAWTRCGASVGGWTQQPVWSRGYLYVGAPPLGGDPALPYTELCVLNTARQPTDPDFVVSVHGGAGASPAVADGTVYSLGTDGLLAFDPSPECLADLDGDGSVGLVDLATLLSAYGTVRDKTGGAYDSDADLNRDGVVDLSDLALMMGVYGESCL